MELAKYGSFNQPERNNERDAFFCSTVRQSGEGRKRRLRALSGSRGDE